MCWLQQSAQLWHYPTFLLPPLIILACIECFAGYRAWRFLLAVNGGVIGFAVGLVLCAELGGSPLLVLASALISGAAGAMLFATVAPLGGFVFVLGSVTSLVVVLLRLAGVPSHWGVLIAMAAGLSGAVAAAAFRRPVTIMVASIAGAQQIASAWCAYHLPPDRVPLADVIDTTEWSAFMALAATGMLIQFATCRKPQAPPQPQSSVA